MQSKKTGQLIKDSADANNIAYESEKLKSHSRIELRKHCKLSKAEVAVVVIGIITYCACVSLSSIMIADGPRQIVWLFMFFGILLSMVFAVIFVHVRSVRFRQDSNLPLKKTGKNYGQLSLSQFSQSQISSFVESVLHRESKNLFIIGNPGSKRTLLICAIGQTLISKCRSVRYYKCEDFSKQFLLAQCDNRLELFIQQILKHEVIILDDIDKVLLNSNESEFLSLLLESRKKYGRLIVTCSQPAVIAGGDMDAAAVVNLISEKLMGNVITVTLDEINSGQNQ